MRQIYAHEWKVAERVQFDVDGRTRFRCELCCTEPVQVIGVRLHDGVAVPLAVSGPGTEKLELALHGFASVILEAQVPFGFSVGQRTLRKAELPEGPSRVGVNLEEEPNLLRAIRQRQREELRAQFSDPLDMPDLYSVDPHAPFEEELVRSAVDEADISPDAEIATSTSGETDAENPPNSSDGTESDPMG